MHKLPEQQKIILVAYLDQVPPDTECGHGPLQRTVRLKLIFNLTKM